MNTETPHGRAIRRWRRGGGDGLVVIGLVILLVQPQLGSILVAIGALGLASDIAAEHRRRRS